eukprot:g30849.t1
MYHLVSAVVLGFTTTIFTEGRIWAASPPSYIAIYFMTIGCGWLYLLMTVWLSMYASISSHSLGVRLRTRYVRLPIPSMQQLYGIASKLNQFEQQGLQKMFRLPFGPQGTPQWDAPRAGVAAPSSANHKLLQKLGAVTESDAALFELQVPMLQGMSLGVYQIVQAINLFVLGLTLVETHCPSVAFAVTLTLQAVALALNFLDLAGMELWQWAFMLVISSGCSVVTAFSLTYAKLTELFVVVAAHALMHDAEALWQYRKQFTVWRKALMVSWQENERVPIPAEVRDSLELKGWSELTAVEKSEDVFTGTLIGPLYGNGQQPGNHGKPYYYDLEKGESIFGVQGEKSLSLKEVGGWVTTFQRAVQGLLALSEPAEDESPQAPDPELASRRRSFTKSMTAFFGQTRPPSQVDNLPWRVLLRLTQVLQCCWIFLGIAEGLCNWFPATFDVPAAEGLRRLRAPVEWWQSLKHVPSRWPHGHFFRPDMLSCAGTRVLAATAFAMYQSSDLAGRATPLLWQALPRRDFSMAVPLCGDDVAMENCSFARSRGDGRLTVSPAVDGSSEDVMELPSRRPWQVFTGAELPCSDGVQQRCFLLAGWDGERLPVAWVRGRELTPSFNLPLPSGSSDLRAMPLGRRGCECQSGTQHYSATQSELSRDAMAEPTGPNPNAPPFIPGGQAFGLLSPEETMRLKSEAAAVQTTIPPIFLPELMQQLEAGRLPPSGYTGGVDDIIARSCPRCEEWRQEVLDLQEEARELDAQCKARIEPAPESAAATAKIQEKEPTKVRSDLIRAVFRACDTNGDDWLGESEFRNIARFYGFDGSDEEWSREFKKLCEEKKVDPKRGIGQTLFGKMLNEDAGLLATNDELRKWLKKLEDNNKKTGGSKEAKAQGGAPREEEGDEFYHKLKRTLVWSGLVRA